MVISFKFLNSKPVYWHLGVYEAGPRALKLLGMVSSGSRGLGFWVLGLGLSLGFRVKGLGFRVVPGKRFRV